VAKSRTARHARDECWHFAKYLAEGRPSQPVHDKEEQAVWRQRQPDHHVENDDHTEMHDVDAQAPRHWNKQRHDHQEDGNLVD
jgi:hypothetical protein